MTRFRVAKTLVAPALMALVVQPSGQAQADSVTDWNVIAINATAVPPNSILQSRVLATVHGAIYDAVRALDQKSAAYAVDLKPGLEGEGRSYRELFRAVKPGRCRPGPAIAGWTAANWSGCSVRAHGKHSETVLDTCSQNPRSKRASRSARASESATGSSARASVSRLGRMPGLSIPGVSSAPPPGR